MSTSDPRDISPQDAGFASEEEMRAAYEQEIKRLRIEHVLLENVVTLVNLGMRRTGLMQGTEDERDPEQVRIAVESVRALLPVLEASAPEQITQIRQALSQLQMAYVQVSGGAESGQPGAGAPAEPPPTSPPAADPTEPGGPGPAQSSGRLWVPGQ